MKITTINGVEYVNKFHYDKLEKKKTPKIIKPEIPSYCDKEYCITDPANVCAIMPIKEIDEDNKIIETYFGEYLEVNSPEITYFHDDNWDIDCFKICETKFSKSYLDNMMKMAEVWFSGRPRIFVKKDDEWGFVKNKPALFIFGNKLAFMLAPRVDND